MVLDKLSSSLKDSLKKIQNSLFVDDKLITEIVKDIQRALLQSDVNVKLVLQLAQKIKERGLKEQPPAGISKKDHVIHILYQELADFLGGEEQELTLKAKSGETDIIMLVGLFGSGKTTTTGKLSRYLKSRGKRVAIVGTDTWRPAAYDQLQQLGKQVDVPVFGSNKEKDPVKIWEQAKKDMGDEHYDVILVDSAGRDALSDELIQELDALYKKVTPSQVLLVISADIGQTAEKQAQMFHDTCHVTGVIITKLDGTAKGGGALSACAVTQAPVLFVGMGEKIDALEKFKPKNFVGRLLGLGDMEALLEKAQEAISEEEAKKLGKNLLSGDFNLIDMFEQFEAMKKMGPLNKVMEMIPGIGNANIPKEMLEGQEEKLEKWKYIMASCTKEELEDPTIISHSRAERIAKGSGTSIKNVRELTKQYKQARKMMKMLKGDAGALGDEKSMQKMMRKMKGMKGMKGMGFG